MNFTNRDWPGDPAPPPPKKTPSSDVLVSLLVVVALIAGSPFVAWLLAVLLPGEQPWVIAIVPAAVLAAIAVFLAAVYINYQKTKGDQK